jgi:hypothetical protein
MDFTSRNGVEKITTDHDLCKKDCFPVGLKMYPARQHFQVAIEVHHAEINGSG